MYVIYRPNMKSIYFFETNEQYEYIACRFPFYSDFHNLLMHAVNLLHVNTMTQINHYSFHHKMEYKGIHVCVHLFKMKFQGFGVD